MTILLCSVPDGSLEDTLQPLIPRVNRDLIIKGYQSKASVMPVGILRILSWMEKNGYSGDIFDINNLRPSDQELIKNFKRIKPTVIGLSATLSWCYPNVKRITKILRKLFPDIWIVVGGHLTGSSNVVLQKTETDICVVGDGEIPFLKLLDYFKIHPTRRQLDFTGLHQIKGLAFIDQNNKLKVTGNAEQLSASEMPQPNLDRHKLGLQKFGGDGKLIDEFFEHITDFSDLLEKFDTKYTLQGQLDSERLEFYEKIKNKRFMSVFSSRGCVARCTFCQRAQKGYRAYAANDFETYITELKEKYNVEGFILKDENFGSDKTQSYEIARIMKKHGFFWAPEGVRCRSVNYEDLKFYKEHNMVSIKFGIESGSQKILDIMEKKSKIKDIYDAISNCKKVGIITSPDAIMIGMPGETRETVIESATFIASLRYLLGMDWNIANSFLAIALPGTPLYEYCQQIGVIGETLDEEEDYLIRLCEEGSSTPILSYLNKTESNIKEVHYWLYLFHYAGLKAYVDLTVKNNKFIKNMFLQLYERCIKGTYNRLIYNFNLEKKSYKNKKLSHKIIWYTSLLVNFLLSLSALILPKAVLFPIVKVYAGLRFNVLKKNHKSITGKQKYNLFVDARTDPLNNLRISENRIAKTTRNIDLSLRTFVTENRNQMKPAITDEEKGLQILAKAQ